MGEGADFVDRGGDTGRPGVVGDRAVVGVEDDHRGGAGLVGEPLLEEVLGGLRLDSGHFEVVDGIAAYGAVEQDRAEGDGDPYGNHQAAVVDGVRADAMQPAGHVEVLPKVELLPEYRKLQ